MLSDEEKKAIKVVNKRTERLIEELKIEEEDLIDEPKIAYLITQIAANKTLVNLIEKQSKEIEELKDKNKKLRDKTKELIFEKQELTSALLDSTPNDKIKAKIEKWDKDIKWNNADDHYYAIKMMQSLLEKE